MQPSHQGIPSSRIPHPVNPRIDLPHSEKNAENSKAVRRMLWRSREVTSPTYICIVEAHVKELGIWECLVTHSALDRTWQVLTAVSCCIRRGNENTSHDLIDISGQ